MTAHGFVRIHGFFHFASVAVGIIVIFKSQKISKDVDGVRSIELLTFQCGYCLVAFAFDLLVFSLRMPKMPCLKLALIVQSICKFH